MLSTHLRLGVAGIQPDGGHRQQQALAGSAAPARAVRVALCGDVQAAGSVSQGRGPPRASVAAGWSHLPPPACRAALCPAARTRTVGVHGRALAGLERLRRRAQRHGAPAGGIKAEAGLAPDALVGRKGLGHPAMRSHSAHLGPNRASSVAALPATVMVAVPRHATSCASARHCGRQRGAEGHMWRVHAAAPVPPGPCAASPAAPQSAWLGRPSRWGSPWLGSSSTASGAQGTRCCKEWRWRERQRERAAGRGRSGGTKLGRDGRPPPARPASSSGRPGEACRPHPEERTSPGLAGWSLWIRSTSSLAPEPAPLPEAPVPGPGAAAGTRRVTAPSLRVPSGCAQGDVRAAPAVQNCGCKRGAVTSVWPLRTLPAGVDGDLDARADHQASRLPRLPTPTHITHSTVDR